MQSCGEIHTGTGQLRESRDEVDVTPNDEQNFDVDMLIGLAGSDPVNMLICTAGTTSSAGEDECSDLDDRNTSDDHPNIDE